MVFHANRIDRRFQNRELFFGCGRDFEAKLREDVVELIRGLFRSVAAHCSGNLVEDVLQEAFSSRVDAEMRVRKHPREENPVAENSGVDMGTTEQTCDLVAHGMSGGGLRDIDGFARGVCREEHSGIAIFRIRQFLWDSKNKNLSLNRA